MPRCRPAPLGVDGDVDVVVKNTFLEVSLDWASLNHDPSLMDYSTGISTAPASFIGAIQRSMAEPAGVPHHVGKGLGQPGTALSQTDVDIGDGSATVASSPRGLWPSTPATPGAPVQISLVMLTGDDEKNAQTMHADAAPFVPALLTCHSAWGQQPQFAGFTEFQPMEFMEFMEFKPEPVLPPPPLGSPKLPPSVQLLESEPTPPAVSPEGNQNAFFACFANAPAPRFEPPSAPAPAPMVMDTEACCEPPAFDVADGSA